MKRYRTGYWIAGAGALLLAGAAGAPVAYAQGNAAAPAAPPPSTIGPPQLRDFSIQPRQRIVAQPPPVLAQPPTIAAPPPVTAAPSVAERARAGATRPIPAPPQQRAAPRPLPAPTTAPATGPAPAEAAPLAQPAPAAPAPAPAAPQGSGFPWIYALPAALLALLALALLRRRRRSAEIGKAVEAAQPEPEAAAAAAVGARPEPVPRPWLELELKAERLSSTDAESLVQFELEIINSGQAPARNLRIDVKMFNAGQEQDKEIGSFFRTAGRESTRCSLPGIRPGTTGAIRGEVAMKRDEMRAVVLDNRYLFVPVIAINALYDWGDGRTGQTSKSYVVGRELESPSEKMGAFRVDQGPRIWRTVGQRQHKLARRV